MAELRIADLPGREAEIGYYEAWETFHGTAEDYVAAYGHGELPGGEWPITPIPVRELWMREWVMLYRFTINFFEAE